MVRPFSMPMAPVMPFRRLHLSCLLRGSNRIRIQQRSGFSTLGRTGQKNKQANNQGAEYYLDVHRRLPPPRLSRLRSAIDLRLLPRYHDVGLVTFCPIARRTAINPGRQQLLQTSSKTQISAASPRRILLANAFLRCESINLTVFPMDRGRIDWGQQCQETNRLE